MEEALQNDVTLQRLQCALTYFRNDLNFTIIANGSEVQVNRTLLELHSEYYRTYFHQQVNPDPKKSTLDVDAGALLYLWEWMSTHPEEREPIHLSKEERKAIALVALQLQLPLTFYQEFFYIGTTLQLIYYNDNFVPIYRQLLDRMNYIEDCLSEEEPLRQAVADLVHQALQVYTELDLTMFNLLFEAANRLDVPREQGVIQLYNLAIQLHPVEQVIKPLPPYTTEYLFRYENPQDRCRPWQARKYIVEFPATTLINTIARVRYELPGRDPATILTDEFTANSQVHCK